MTNHVDYPAYINQNKCSILETVKSLRLVQMFKVFLFSDSLELIHGNAQYLFIRIHVHLVIH